MHLQVYLYICEFGDFQGDNGRPHSRLITRAPVTATTATTEDPAKVFTTRRAPHADHRILAVVLCRRVTLCCVFVLYCVVYLCCTAVLASIRDFTPR